MYGLVPCIPILRVFFIKSAKRLCICEHVIFCIDTCEKCFVMFEKGYKQVIASGSCKRYCFSRNG